MRRTCGRERKQIPRLEGSTRMESVDANERRCLHTRAHTHTHTHTLGEGEVRGGEVCVCVCVCVFVGEGVGGADNA